MKKSLILFTFLTCCMLSCWSATALRIWLVDGTQATYVLDAHPTVTYPGSDMTVATATASATYPRADVVKMDFTDSGSGSVEQILAENPGALAYINNCLMANGLEITVSDLSGRIRLSGIGSVSVADLPAGIYIATAGNCSLKIVR